MRIAITGGIAAGKSTVCWKLLERLNSDGFQPYAAESVDSIVKGIYAELEDAELRPANDLKIEELYKHLINLCGTVKKAEVAQKCVDNHSLLPFVEKLFSDLVEFRIKEALEVGNVVIEFPLLHEKGYGKYFDFIVNVEAPESVRDERALARAGMAGEKLEFIKRNQATDRLRREASHYTFVNETPEDLEAHVGVIATRILTDDGRRNALVSGSFDPITNGHMWLIERGLHMMDHIVVVVAYNPAKKGMFDLKERIELIKTAVEDAWLDTRRVHILSLPKNEMVINLAAELRAKYIIRGLRNTTDFEYERQIDLVQSKIAPLVETLYLMTPRELTEVSSSMVKSLYGLNGWWDITQPYVPECVLEELSRRLEPSSETSSMETSASTVLPA